MKFVEALLVTVSMATGLWAAWRWWQASRIEIKPFIEPVGYETGAWVNEARFAIAKANALNARAAFWTAIAAACGALAAMVGLLIPN